MIDEEEQEILADEDGEEVNIVLPGDVKGKSDVDAKIESEIQVTQSDLGIEEVRIDTLCRSKSVV